MTCKIPLIASCMRTNMDVLRKLALLSVGFVVAKTVFSQPPPPPPPPTPTYIPLPEAISIIHFHGV